MNSKILNNLTCKQILYTSGYRGSTKAVIVFMDKDANIYTWITSSPLIQLKKGKTYDIQAQLDEIDNRLSRLKILKIYEQDDTKITLKSTLDAIDAMDVLFGEANYAKY